MIQLAGNSLKSYDDFKKAVGMTESSNNYKSVNSIGCMGKYQFCPSTFKRISKLVLGKVLDKKSFLASPQTQEAFFDKLVQLNTSDLYKHLPQARKTLGNWVTLSGLIGGAHLGGSGSIAKKSGVLGLVYFGKDRKDGNGTKISDYVKRFSGYEIPNFAEDNNYSNTAILEEKKKHKTTDIVVKKNANQGTNHTTVYETDWTKEMILPVAGALGTAFIIYLFFRKRTA